MCYCIFIIFREPTETVKEKTIRKHKIYIHYLLRLISSALRARNKYLVTQELSTISTIEFCDF